MIPPAAQVGETVVVNFTVEGGGCSRSARPEVSVDGLDARIRPFALRYRGDGACTSDLRLDPHKVELRFLTTGTARIEFVGTDIVRTVSITP